MENLGVLIYTHNRIDDAKINMEIIRNVWQKSDYFKNVEIIHSFNGKKEWYPEKYLEDNLVVSKNSWHFQGASDLIDAGIKKFKKDIDYVIVLAADTWLIRPNYLKKLLEKMKRENFLLATCAWGRAGQKNDMRVAGMATDFFVVDLKWARKYKLFPINYKKFHNKYKDLLLYQNGGNIMLEKLMLVRFMEAIGREQNFGGSTRKRAFERMLIMKDREPVHSGVRKDGAWIRKMYWPKIGLLTHHDPYSKRKILKTKKIKGSENINKLLKSSDLTYYNNGITRFQYSSN